MKLRSLIREKDKLMTVEVELSFLPGLPQIQFLGLPDQVIKESIHRIKSAIRSQGFEFPKAQQVLVNVRPSHLKKSSRGLELAVALGILWETGQVAVPEEDAVLVYGELSLSGEIFEPEDLIEDYEGELTDRVWTGTSRHPRPAPFDRAVIKSLGEIQNTELIVGTAREYRLERPRFGLDLSFPLRQAEVLKVVALGEHSLLLAGPAGSGKSTFAKTVQSLLQEPSQEQMHTIRNNNKELGGEPLLWRPLVHPHHSTSPLGLIGGGVPPFKGEITRADQGMMVLDELLEFHPRAQEALREPMEEFRIRLRRGRFVEEHPAETLVISTTNLCPCGDWVPQSKVVCGRSLKKCQSYLERLSGPLVDRFQIIHFTQKRETGETILGSELLKTLEQARSVRAARATKDPRFRKVVGRWSWEELTQDLPEFYLRELFPKDLSSRRRDIATLRVARSLADLELKENIEPSFVEKALRMTFAPFQSLKHLGG